LKSQTSGILKNIVIVINQHPICWFFMHLAASLGVVAAYLTRPLCHGVYLGFLNYKLVWRSIYRDLIRLSSYSETVTMQVWPWVYQKHFLDTVIL
jgi:hypothetical protein